MIIDGFNDFPIKVPMKSWFQIMVWQQNDSKTQRWQTPWCSLWKSRSHGSPGNIPDYIKSRNLEMLSQSRLIIEFNQEKPWFPVECLISNRFNEGKAMVKPDQRPGHSTVASRRPDQYSRVARPFGSKKLLGILQWKKGLNLISLFHPAGANYSSIIHAGVCYPELCLWGGASIPNNDE